jgi:hypothetical protein
MFWCIRNTFTVLKRLALAFTASIFVIFLLSSCKEDPPVVPPDAAKKDTVTISIYDVTHRSVSLNIKTTQHNPGRIIKLYRDYSQLILYPASASDTVIIDDNNGTGLSLNTSYTWYAVSTDSKGMIKDSSNRIEVSTLDTTSHDYSWEVIIPGGATYSNDLHDVWGLDDNNVYAAGAVTLNDTTRAVLKWDGQKWDPLFRGGGMYAIYGFSTDDIWIAGNLVFHYDGTEWTHINDPVIDNNVPYYALWGSGSKDIYLGSERGKLIHWDGQKARVAADFGIYIKDIYGTSANEIWVSGSIGIPDKLLLARFNGTSFEHVINQPPVSGTLHTVYTTRNNEVYVGGNGVFKKKGEQWVNENVNDVIRKIRGSNSNNIFAVGAYCSVYHYNGSTWKYYDELRTQGGINYGVYVTENKVFIVGINEDHLRAKIIIGTRRN